MTSSTLERGLTADLYLSRPTVGARPRRFKRATVLAAVLGFVALMLCDQVPGSLQGGDVNAQDTQTAQVNNTYEFAVYMLNHTRRTSTGTSTWFTFDAGELPFNFDDLLFGEFRQDTEYCSRYYGGLSLLVRAEGAAASIKFSERNAKEIETIIYKGQHLIVLNGWESVSRDSQGSIIDHRWGSMQIPAYDWRDGLWSPGSGITVKHPTNVTISTAALCLMVYEPMGNTDIPEYGLVHACIALAAVVILLRRRMAQPRTTEKG